MASHQIIVRARADDETQSYCWKEITIMKIVLTKEEQEKREAIARKIRADVNQVKPYRRYAVIA